MVTLRTFSIGAVCVALPLLTVVAARADVPTLQVRICIPPRLVTEQSWDKPVPGSNMAAFRSLIRDYVAAHGGSGDAAYWIADDAFERFVALNGASYPVDPETLVIAVSARFACPETNYAAQLEVDSPAPVAQTNQYSSAPDTSTSSAPAASANENTDDGATIELGAGAAAALWCMATNCLGGSADESAPTSTTDDEPYADQ